MLTEAEIERIAKRIIDGYAPLVVGLFGSYAIGAAHDCSDLDLFVIKQTVERPAARRRAVQRLLFGVMHKVDTHVFTPRNSRKAPTTSTCSIGSSSGKPGSIAGRRKRAAKSTTAQAEKSS